MKGNGGKMDHAIEGKILTEGISRATMKTVVLDTIAR
jgi:hypothetical protein